MEDLKADVKALAEEYQKNGDSMPLSYKKAYDKMGVYSEAAEKKMKKASDDTKEKIEDDADEMSDSHKKSSDHAASHWKSAFSVIRKASSATVKVFATGAKVVATGVTAAVAGVSALSAAAISGYAEYEQLVGGVETLFKDSSDTVMNYANNAYKTAGMSANDYMETVTGFSASLLQSLDNDTAAAAAKADLAITDMSDNANKMGTSIEMIQYAYQGFAKQNYTMLDNLKLGYGGTKEEMERLLEDAEKISGIKYDISSYADIVDAIHVIQTEMGITETTAKEASTTIEGSLNSAKAAWSNLLVGIADDEQDFDTLVNNFVDSVATAAENILPRVEVAITGIGTLIEKLFPVIMQELPTVLNDILPELVSSGIGMVNSLSEGIKQNLPLIISTVIEVGEQLIDALIEVVPQFISIGLELITQLAMGIAEALPELMPKIADAIDTIVIAIQENLPLILEAGMQILLQLALGIAQSLPELIPTIIEIILQIVETLNSPENMMLVANAALQLIFGLLEGIINALPVLIEGLPEVIMSIVDALIECAPQLLEAGYELLKELEAGINEQLPVLLQKIPQMVLKLTNKFLSLASKFLEVGKKFIGNIKDSIVSKWEELKSSVPEWISSMIEKFLGAALGFVSVGDNIVQGIWDGISSGWNWLLDKVGGLASDLLAKVKDILNIHSPSREFAYIGRMCVAGFDEGIDQLMNPEGVTKNIKASLDVLSSAERGKAYYGGEGGSFTQILNINREISTPDELARATRIEARYGLMKGVPVYGY